MKTASSADTITAQPSDEFIRQYQAAQPGEFIEYFFGNLAYARDKKLKSQGLANAAFAWDRHIDGTANLLQKKVAMIGSDGKPVHSDLHDFHYFIVRKRSVS